MKCEVKEGVEPLLMIGRGLWAEELWAGSWYGIALFHLHFSFCWWSFHLIDADFTFDDDDDDDDDDDLRDCTGERMFLFDSDAHWGKSVARCDGRYEMMNGLTIDSATNIVLRLTPPFCRSSPPTDNMSS